MHARVLPGILAAVCLGAVRVPAQATPDLEQTPFTELSGADLILRLAEGRSRPRAFYELWRRAEPGEDEGFEEFDVGHYDPEIVICPQGDGEPPIHLVLCGFLGRSDLALGDGYTVEKPTELFVSAPDSPARARHEKPLIEAFTADGRRVEPFDGNNVLDGTLSDINADGTIERVEVTNCAVDGVERVGVLSIATVKTEAVPLLNVLLNWGADEWTFRLVDEDDDGVSEIAAGPRTGAGLKPKAVWKWDRAKHAYVGPAGQAGDHFRVLDQADIWKDFERFKAARLEFPIDADAVSGDDPTLPSPPPESRPTDPPASPGERYRFTSLQGVSDADLFRFMARGKSEFDREHEALIRSRLPDGFWTADPKSATLALINANRTDAHRAKYQIAIDDRDKAEPPARCTIAFSDSSSRCYNAVDAHYFLRVDPQDSYLAYARSWAGGVVFYSAVHDQPAFDLRLCPLGYEDARKLADVIWWLDRVRSRISRSESGSSSMGSTADGRGKLTFRANGRGEIERAGTLWAAYLSDRWNNEYNHATFLNFAAYLIADALPARLGKQWSRFEPKHSQDSIDRQTSAPLYAEAEQKRLRELGERFLGWFAPDQERVSVSIVAEAARLAGVFAIESQVEQLRAIESSLAPSWTPKRTFEEVSAERDKLPDPFDEKDREKRKELEQQRAALDAEIDSILADPDTDRDGADHLRRTTALSLRQIAAANDSEALLAWAVSKSDGCQWAFQRLAQVDRKRYAEALEALMLRSDGKWARQFFQELAQTDPARAAAIARELPADKEAALAVSAFLLLRDAEVLPDEAGRVATIIQIMHDPRSGWEERRRAIELLVPLEAPLRYPGREVDAALLKLFEPGQADDLINFSLEGACRALARRGRIDLFERMAQQIESTTDPHIYHGVLGALTHLAQFDPPRLNPRLLAILKPHLSQTNKQMTEILWAVWSADLRELQPEIERLATRSPDEYEDGKAHSYGGSVSPVAGRFHLARMIVSLWTEPDPVARARLLIAFALTNDHGFVGEPVPERLARMKAELSRVASELRPEAKAQLAAFLDRLRREPPTVGDDPIDDETCRRVADLARETLRL